MVVEVRAIVGAGLAAGVDAAGSAGAATGGFGVGRGIVGSVTPGGTGAPGFLIVRTLGTLGGPGLAPFAALAAPANSDRSRVATMSSTVLRFDFASIPSSFRRAITSETLMFNSLASCPTRTLPI